MPVRPEAAIEPSDITLLAGNFPSGLNTATPDTDLDVDETPDAYGMDIDADGVIAKDTTIPTCAARTLKSVTLTEGALSVPYSMAYRRLWNITNRTAATASNILTYGAQDYTDIYVPQRIGKIHFDEDTDTILAIQPFGRDAMWIAKATGGYVLSGLNDTRAFWDKSDLVEEMKCGGATGLRELDGVIYVSGTSTTKGLWAYDRGQVKEVLRKVRDDYTNFGNVALTVDYEKKYIKGGSSYIYEVPTDKIFRWSSTDFRYTTRRFHLREYQPFAVQAVWMIVGHTDRDDGWFKYQVRVEDEYWDDEDFQAVNFGQQEFTAFKLHMDNPRCNMCRKWQMRFTDLSDNLKIKELRLELNESAMSNYSR